MSASFICSADFPVDDEAAASVQHAAQVVEGAADVEVGDVHVPVLVRLQRLDKAGSFPGGAPFLTPQTVRPRAPDRRWRG